VNAPVSPTKLARDIDILARRHRIVEVLSDGRDMTASEIATELDMAPVNVLFVLSDLKLDKRVESDANDEKWWLR